VTSFLRNWSEGVERFLHFSRKRQREFLGLGRKHLFITILQTALKNAAPGL